MKRLLLTAMLLIACTLAALAHTCRVTGTVTGPTGETLPYATIAAAQGETVTKRIAANEQGAFALDLEQGKTYTLTFTSVGYAAHTRTLDIPEAASLSLGTIGLRADTQLDEVVIEAQKPIIKADAEKITYDVSADPEADSQKLIDLMRKVPMVTVDADENVQLNGSSDFKVLVNGKESVMMKNNLKETLKSMPASSVKDIQVITNPSTRYDAEGVGGVINIVTTRDEIEGITGTISAYGDIMGGFGGNAYLAWQHKRFTASINYSGGRYMSRQYSHNETYNYNNPDAYRSTIGFDESTVAGHYHFLNFESSFEADSLNLFSLGISGNIFKGGVDLPIVTQVFNIDNKLVNNYIDNYMMDTRFGGISANLDYQHTFGRVGHTLVASYRYEYNPTGLITTDSISLATAMTAPYEGQSSDNSSCSQEHTVQLDYANPINDHHSIEGGAKYIGRISGSNDTYSLLTRGLWQPTGEVRNMDYTQQIMALYAGYAFNLNSFGLRVGGRYERTWVDATLQRDGQTIQFGSPYDNFVPYASVNYTIDPQQSMRLSYTQRINRPRISRLSPFEQWTGALSVDYGNPYLRPEVSHSISAAYSIFKGTFNLNMEWNSRITNNSIVGYKFVDAATGVTHNTVDNLGRRQSHGLAAFISGQVSQRFSYYSNMGARYVIYDAKAVDMYNEGWEANIGAGIQWNAWKRGTINVNGGIGSPWVDLQGNGTRPWYYYGVSVSQRFLDDKLKVTLSANNFLTKYNMWCEESAGDGFMTTSEHGGKNAKLQVSISYTFGKLDAQVKKALRGIVNDDSGSDDNKGGSSGGMNIGR